MTASLFKSPELSWVFWPILTRFFWMILAHLQIFNSSSPLSKPFVTVPRIDVTFMFHRFLYSLAETYCLSFCFLYFHSEFHRDRYIHLESGSLFFFRFVNYYFVWSSGRDKGVRFCLKIRENFVCLIRQGGFWFVYITFGIIFTFKFLESFLVDHFPHPVVTCWIHLILFTIWEFLNRGYL